MTKWNRLFLESVMRKLGFEERWIQLVMSCVRKISYSVVVNGHPMGNIQPTRGIRQGDPILLIFFCFVLKLSVL